MSHRSRQDGLTLLEVLAAFLIFSLVFTVLVGSSQSGVKSQGLSARRLAANEVAQRVLTDLEIAMTGEELPVVPEEEYTDDAFTVRVRETNLADGNVGAASPSGPNSQPNSGFTPGLELAPGMGGGLDIMSMLSMQMPEVSKYLIRYEVEVEWTEGAQLHRVAHTTFAFDWKTASAETSIGEALSSGDSLDGLDGGRDDETSDATEEGRDSGSSGDRNRSQEQQDEIERLKEPFRELGIDF